MISRLLLVMGLLFSLSVLAAEHQLNDRFPLGVRSGDPSDKGVVVWTRVNPQKCTGNDFVSLEVATDRNFSKTQIKETLQVDPQMDYTLHADLEGRLQPDTVYYYRFVHQGEASRIGRTRTLPHRDQEKPIRMAVLTCQDFSTGYFNTHQILGEMAEKGELDLAFFDGDFTYEYASYDSSAAKVIRPLDFPSHSPSAMTAEDFRFLYHSYLSDPQLQSSLASMPFIVIPDDHEVADNQYWDRERNQAGISGKRYKFLSALEKSRLMLDSRKTWVNYTPARIPVNRITDNPQQYVRLYRSFRLGKMADFFVTDSRSYRDGEHVPADDPNKTMLGREQVTWVKKQLEQSDAHWRLWGNQTMFSRFLAYGEHIDVLPDGLVNTDQWNGFLAERAMLKEQLDQSNIHNLLILTGDMHTSLVSQVKPFDRPDASDHLAVEFMTPSVTSPNMKDEIGFIGSFDRIMDLIRYYLKDQNHHLAHFNSEIHGFAVLTLNKDEVVWDVYNVPTHERLEHPKSTHVLKAVYRDNVLKIVFDKS